MNHQNNSVSRLQIVLKFNMLAQYGSSKAAKLLKSTFTQIQGGGRRPNWTYSNRSNSSADCSISLKFGMCVQLRALARD